MGERTLGTLAQEDIGRVITISDGLVTIEGVLAEVRHLRGDTSGRPVTEVRLLHREGDEIRAYSNLTTEPVWQYRNDSKHVRIPNASDKAISVRPDEEGRDHAE